MSLVSFKYGTQEGIKNAEFKDGCIYYATDSGAIAYDVFGSRHWNYDVKCHTTAEWAELSSYIPPAGELIIYTDYEEIEEGVYRPGVKVGSGNAYVPHLAFINESIPSEVMAHIQDRNIHITSDERTFWNNKMRCYIDMNDSEVLVFTTN